MSASVGHAHALDDDRARPFLPDAATLERAVLVAGAQPPLADEVVAALERYAADLPEDPSRTAAFAALRAGAAVVVAGQQPGLFAGPELTDQKIATAVAIADRLGAAGRPAVPIFWNASEDHDVDEADRLFLREPDRASTRLVHVGLRRTTALAHLELTAAQRTQLEEAFLASGESAPGADDLPRTGESFSWWTTRLIARRFFGRGLVILEPHALAAAAVPIKTRILRRREALDHALRARNDALAAAGFALQAEAPPPGQSLLFHVGATRERLVATGSGWAAGDAEWTEHALLERLDAQPEMLSSSALARPLVQQALLGAAVQVAGPSEASYLAQISGCHALLDLREPVVWPRLEAAFVTASDLRALIDADLDADTALAAPERLVAPGAEVPGDWAAARARILAALADARHAIERDAALFPADVSAPLVADLERARARFDDRFEKAAQRLGRDAGRRHQRARESLWPRGKRQDRVRSLVCYRDWPDAVLVEAMIAAAARDERRCVPLLLDDELRR